MIGLPTQTEKTIPKEMFSLSLYQFISDTLATIAVDQAVKYWLVFHNLI